MARPGRQGRGGGSGRQAPPRRDRTRPQSTGYARPRGNGGWTGAAPVLEEGTTAVDSVPIAVEETESRLTAMLAPSIDSLGFELVRIKMVGTPGGKTLQVMADPLPEESGARRTMTVEDCTEISRAISAILDVEDPIAGAYALEVSSPGLDRPLTKPDHFERFTGFEARVELLEPMDGQKRFRGRILGVEAAQDEDAATIQLKGDQGDVSLPFRAVAKAKLLLTDDLLAAAQAGRL